MPIYAYEARTLTGELRAGQVEADNRDKAGRLLSERDLFVVRIAVERAAKVRRARVAGHATRAQLAWHLTQLAVMVETGMRISDALECLTRQTEHPRLRTFLEGVSGAVHEGRPFSEALAQFPRAVPGSIVAMVRASEMSGTLGSVLRRCADHLLHDLQTRKRVRGAMMYPAFMLVGCLGVSVFLLTVILPRFAVIFASRGALLPAPTRILIALSENLIAYWYFWIAGAVALVCATVVWVRSAVGRRQCDYLAVHAPILSNVCNAMFQARTFRTVALLLDAGVSLSDVMTIIHEVVPNAYYRRLWTEVESEIQRGERLSGPLLTSDLIPEPIAQMIDNADRAGQLGTVFGRLAEFVEEEYERLLAALTKFIEPCMILLMGGVIGFVAAALMLPMFQMSKLVTG